MIYRLLYTNTKIIFLALLLFICGVTGAQEHASIKKDVSHPALYNIRVNTGYVSGGDYETEGVESLIGTGSMGDAYMTEVDFSVPVLTFKSGGRISLGAYYNYMHQCFTPDYRTETYEPVRFNNNNHTWGANATYSFRSKLFGKMLFGFANVRMECSQYGWERISGFAATALLIKRTERSSFMLGAAMLLNSSSRWPLFPFITYWYKFNEKWELNIKAPQCHIVYNISEKDKLLMGTTLGGEHFYIRPHHSNLPSTVMYSRSYARPELVYEHDFTPLMRCSLRCGSIVYINGKFNSSNGNRKYGEIDHDANVFLQVSFSYGLNNF